MGLFKKLEESGISKALADEKTDSSKTINTVKSPSIGLLKKSMQLSEKSGLDFFDFIHKYDFFSFAVFNLIDNNFIITCSYGFDGKSIINSVSTPSYWNGTIPQRNRWYYFQNLGLAPFYQFFSFKMKEEVNSVQIYFTDDNKIIFICKKEKNLSEFKSVEENILKDFYAIDFTDKNVFDFNEYKKLTKLSLSFINVFNNSSYEITKGLENTLLFEIKNYLSELLGKNFVKSENNVFYLNLNYPDINLMKKHLVFSLSNLYSIPAINFAFEEVK